MLSKTLLLSLLPVALCAPVTVTDYTVVATVTTPCTTTTGGPAAVSTAPSSGGVSSGSGSSSSGSGSSGQTAFSFPLANGFPSPNATALKAIEKQAQGTLPNYKLPSKISDMSDVIFEVIAFNEIFEVAFYSSLIQNITNDVPGFQAKDYAPDTKENVLKIFKTIQAQEELHALGANGILTSAGRQPVMPCKYVFPTANFDDALAFASTFTDLVLGVLQEATAGFCTDGDNEFIGLLASIIGQEGEQDGYFRYINKKVPSALPFLSAASAAWGYSALNQLVVVAGSCPASPAIPVPIFKPLTLATTPNENTTSINYSIQSTAAAAAGYSLVYTNQQNTPVVLPLKNVAASGSAVTFSADFPYAQYELNGLTIAAVTNSAGPFTNASQVAAATVFGPGLIEIN